SEPAPAREPRLEPETATADAPPERAARRPAALTIEPRISRHVPHRAAARDDARAPAQAAPTVNVTIGRVEVRAVPAPPAPAARRAASPPHMSLEEYLRRRAGGGAG
ncbi:MAG TPA: hypothetical protein VN228_11690, partial [Pyrinomonadaceae bacterium]|nr:hypothetical protein [Pyrinomonadaceae bacterium]